MPNIADPFFSNSVVLLCEHNKKGAMGIIINKKIDKSILNQIIDEKYYKDKLPQTSIDNIFFGGPVLINKGFMLHRSVDKTKNTIKISSDFSITDYKNGQSLIDKKNRFDYKLVFGHAGWSAGQLENEIKKGDWIMQNINPDFVFKSNYDKMWDNATLSLGFELGSITVNNAKA
tara:strand:+ start:155 stop:676 length:522 start_codon:yes stop_codon:yes gene_type:complete